MTDSESTGPPFTESAKALYEAARTLAGSWGGTFTALRRVLAADVALARAAIVEWILMVVIAAVLFGTGWMLLTTIAVLGLHRAGLNWFVALSIPLVVSVAFGLYALRRGSRALPHADMDASRRQLTLWFGTRAEVQEAKTAPADTLHAGAKPNAPPPDGSEPPAKTAEPASGEDGTTDDESKPPAGDGA